MSTATSQPHHRPIIPPPPKNPAITRTRYNPPEPAATTTDRPRMSQTNQIAVLAHRIAYANRWLTAYKTSLVLVISGMCGLTATERYDTFWYLMSAGVIVVVFLSISIYHYDRSTKRLLRTMENLL